MSDYLLPIGLTILPNLGAFAGNLFTGKEKRSKDVAWFKALKKPDYKPPSWVIVPVWTCLNCSMGYASYMVWRDGGGLDGQAALPLACYGTQLAMNWTWSLIFFKGHKLGLATGWTFGLWSAILATIVTFRPVNSTASYMLYPYLGWVSIASLITFKIWRMNKDRTD